MAIAYGIFKIRKVVWHNEVFIVSLCGNFCQICCTIEFVKRHLFLLKVIPVVVTYIFIMHSYIYSMCMDLVPIGILSKKFHHTKECTLYKFRHLKIRSTYPTNKIFLQGWMSYSKICKVFSKIKYQAKKFL